jgi:hypothetical protein
MLLPSLVGTCPLIFLPGNTEKIFSLTTDIITRKDNHSAEENEMADSLRKLLCCMLLVALVGTASAGYGTVFKTGTGAPVAGSYPGDKGLLRSTGGSGTNTIVTTGCYFPIINLPAYYVCIMFCKIGGGGDSCAPSCEAALSVCD